MVAKAKANMAYIIYLTLAAVMSVGLLMTIYFEPTDDALALASYGERIFYGAAIAAGVYCLACGVLFNRYRRLTYGLVPVILASVTLHFAPQTFYPQLIFAASLGAAVTVFFMDNQDPKTRRLVAGLSIALVLLAGYWCISTYHYNNRTGDDNPYTNECIALGYSGAKGDACTGTLPSPNQ